MYCVIFYLFLVMVLPQTITSGTLIFASHSECIFGGFNMDVATFLERPSNLSLHHCFVLNGLLELLEYEHMVFVCS